MFKQTLGCRRGYTMAAVVGLAVFCCAAEAQTTLNVDSGQYLTGMDLTNGMFNGQAFTLGPDLTIEVNDGGRVADLGNVFTKLPFSFAGSAVNVNNGGTFGLFQSLVSDVTMNVYTGGTVNSTGIANAGSVNVLGGEVALGETLSGGAVITMSSGRLSTDFGDGLTGGTVTVTGGTLERNFAVKSGGTLSISGGKIDEEFETASGANVTFTGNEFQLNGLGIADFSGGWPQNSVFTGTLADGSVFILGDQAFDRITPSTLTLVSLPLPPIDTTPQVLSSGVLSAGLRSGQSLTLMDGGTLGDHFAVVGAAINIQGGAVGENLETAYSTVNISGGHIGDRSQRIGDYISFFDGSVVNITGGLFSDKVHPLAGSTVGVSGGVFEDGIRIRKDSSVALYGDDFQLNGSPVSDMSAGLPEGGVFTGTLADGTVFIFAHQGVATSAGGGSMIESGTTTLVPTPLAPPDTTPQIVSAGIGPQGLRPGQTLTLKDGGALGNNFNAVGATLFIEGGQVGDLLKAAYSQVEISGGVINGSFTVYDGATVHMTGGEIVDGLEVFSGAHTTISNGTVRSILAYDTGSVLIEGGDTTQVFASRGADVVIRGGQVGQLFGVSGQTQITVEDGVINSVSVGDATLSLHGGSLGDRMSVGSDAVVNITAGAVGNSLRVNSRGVVNVSGGIIGSGFTASYQSVVNVSGGVFGSAFTALMGSEVNLLVSELLLDGVPVDLTLDTPYLVTERNGVLLTAILADGSTFDLTLNQNNLLGQDWIDANATLTATLVPEPAALSLLVLVGLLVHRRRSHNLGG